MNLLNRMMSYDKAKIENQEKCNCAECLGNAEISEKKQIACDFKYVDDFLIKVENYRMRCRERKILNTMNLEYWYKDVKTKNFIWKSLHVHGDKYIYHKSVYMKSKEKLLIECRNGHEPFPQSPNDHLNGHGCKLCGIKTLSEKQKMTLKEFIEEANKVHGKGRYDYSEVIFAGYQGRNMFNRVDSVEDVMAMVEKYADADFVLEPEKRAVSDRYFASRHNVCARLYNQICSVDEKEVAQ